MDVSLLPAPKLRHLIQGDVVIHPTVVIGAEVILEASPGSQLILAEGVCLGRGVVLQAYQGTLKIEAGASLGTGVLIVGSGKIGAMSCIGAATTIFNADIASEQIVPANSLIGDPSRRWSEQSETVFQAFKSENLQALPSENLDNARPSLSEADAVDQASEQSEAAMNSAAAGSAELNLKSGSGELQVEEVSSSALGGAAEAPPEIQEAARSPTQSESTQSEPTQSEPSQSKSSYSEPSPETALSVPQTSSNGQAHGQEYVNRLIGKLLPGRRLI